MYYFYFTINKREKKIKETVEVFSDYDSENVKLPQRFKPKTKFKIGLALFSLINIDIDNGNLKKKLFEIWQVDHSPEQLAHLKAYRELFLKNISKRYVFDHSSFDFYQESDRLGNAVPLLITNKDTVLAIERLTEDKGKDKSKVRDIDKDTFNALLLRLNPPAPSFSAYKEEQKDPQKNLERKRDIKNASDEMKNLITCFLPNYLLRLGFQVDNFIDLCQLEMAFILSMGLKIKMCPYCSSCFAVGKNIIKYCDKCRKENAKVMVYRQKKGDEECRKYHREYMREKRRKDKT